MVISLFSNERIEPRLDGRRIYLRPPAKRDFQQWSAVRGESRDFLVPWEPSWAADALSRSAFRRFLERKAEDWERDTGYAFFVFRRGDDGLLGGLNLNNVRRGVAQMASLGYWIGQPHTRRGYMTEGLSCACRFAFETLNLHRLEAACLPHNRASRALLLKSGFREEGLARRYLRINGEWQDHVLFGILRDDVRSATP